MRALVVVMVLVASTAVVRADDGEDAAWDGEQAAPGAEQAAPGAVQAAPGAVQGPPIGEVLAAAYRAAGLDRDLGRGFVRRARLGGLVPWLTVRGGTNTSWHVDDPDADVGRGTTFEVRATWRLDRLVFDGHELQVAAMNAARRRERRRVANRAIRAYFTWRRAVIARSVTRAEEAAAELDAMTDGWFSQARRSASETRTSCRGPAATP